MKLRTKKFFFSDTRLPEKPMEDLAKYISNSKDGRITASQYNEIFGYYDNLTGVTNPGIYQNVKDINNKYQDSLINNFADILTSRLSDALSDKAIKDNELVKVIQDQSREFANNNREVILSNKENSFSDMVIDFITKNLNKCGAKGNIDFAESNSVGQDYPDRNDKNDTRFYRKQKFINQTFNKLRKESFDDIKNALIDCLKGKKLP